MAERLLEEVLANAKRRKDRTRPVTRRQAAAMMKAVFAEVAAQRRLENGEPFSFSRALKGMLALKGEVLDSASRDEDVAYCRALTTGATPGSYLVPVIQANEILQQLAQQSITRLAGATIWPMRGVQALSVPSAVVSPSVIWAAQNSKVTPDSAATFGSMSFVLKMQESLLQIPLALLKAATPAFDAIFSTCFAAAIAESEDQAILASSTLTGAPTALLAASGITTINCQGSANGGNLGYSDVLACLLKAAQLKMKPPFCWFCSPRTLYTRLLGLQDTTSRPLLIPDVTDSVSSGYSLMGFPVFVSASISETESLGSGSGQSHLILAKPNAVHIGESGDVQMDVALEAYFDSAQVGLRISHWVDVGYAPAASIICLLGIN